MFRFENLDIWEEAEEYCVLIYKITEKYRGLNSFFNFPASKISHISFFEYCWRVSFNYSKRIWYVHWV